MRPEKLGRVIDPAILSRGGIYWVERIVDAVVLLVGFAHHQEPNLFVRVVDKGMTDAGSGGKTYAIARFKLPQIAINPGFRISFKHINELFFVAFRMRIGCPTSGG